MTNKVKHVNELVRLFLKEVIKWDLRKKSGFCLRQCLVETHKLTSRIASGQ